jgi:hypothetical protein
MRLANAGWGAGACSVVIGLLGLVPNATATSTFKPCGKIVGNEHVVAMKVEVSGMPCEAASKAIKSPKTPAQLGYRCVVTARPPLEYFTCHRKTGGTVRFRETVQRG